MQSWHGAIERLDSFIAEGRVGEYYETVFADMVADGSIKLDAAFFDENKWYEIDTVPDLNQAELMFPGTPLVASAVLRPGRCGFSTRVKINVFRPLVAMRVKSMVFQLKKSKLPRR